MNRARLLSLIVLGVGLQINAYQSAPPGTMGQAGFGPDAATVATWEAQAQSDPDNVQVRGNLLAYYAAFGPADKYFGQALWMVQHHPEAPYAGLMLAHPKQSGETLSEADYALLKSAWEQALIDQADNGKVLYNAGSFFARRDPVRAIHLFEQTRQLDPENERITRTEAGLYLRGFVKPSPYPSENLTAEQIQALQAELTATTDPALLVDVGSRLIQLGRAAGPDTNLKAKGTELINRAISLDPNNEKWKTAAERAALAPPPPPPPPPGANNGPNGPVRVSAAVAEANLIRRVEPVYPEMAVAARISGTVEFTAIIDEQGHIANLQLVRGHPLLVNAAKNAILQYAYKPTLLNGNPVPVVAPVVVKFEAAAQ